MVVIKKNDFVEYKFENYILNIKILKPQPTDEEWEFTKKTIIGFYEAALQKQYRFSLIFDLNNLGILDTNKIKEWANLFIQNKENTKKVINKSTMITNNTLVRITLNLFLTMYQTSRPSKLVGTYQEALEFINS
jgi:hypothetical protein